MTTNVTVTGTTATVTDDGSTVVVSTAAGSIWGTISGTLANQADLTSALADKTDDADLPYAVSVPGMVLPNAYSSVTQIYTASSLYNTWCYTSATIDQYLEWSITVAAGTYTLRSMFRSSNNHGIASISIDGGAALGTTVDMYSASGTNNNVTDITGIALTAGRHSIRWTGATKNASSSAYLIHLHGFTLARTGA